MRNFFTIWRKELTSCFLSPVAYIVLIVFLLMSNWMFWNAVLHNEGRDEPLLGLLTISILFFSPILITVVTMRLFSEESHSGTLETLLTAPVTETELVLGKYLGAFSFLTIVLIPALGAVCILQFMSPGIAAIDPGELAGSALVIFLFCGYCTAIGLLASLLTRNQVVAAICCFCGTLIPITGPMILPTIPFCPDKVVQYFSVTDHLADFAMGSIDLRPVVLYVSLILFVLFLSVQMLESRRWR